MRLFPFGRGAGADEGDFASHTATLLCVRTGPFTAAAERNTEMAFRRLATTEAFVTRTLEAHAGRVLNAFNASYVASFASAPEALKAALALVTPPEPGGGDRLPLVCGLHSGQIYVRGRHLFGSSINTAQRVCALGRPRDVVLSGSVAPLVEPHLPERLALERLDLALKGGAQTVFRIAAVEDLASERRSTFISYRRDGGAEVARLISYALQKRGVETFLDADDLRATHFDEQIYRRIEAMPNFVVVLTPGCLDRCHEADDWLRREVAHALQTKRNIVPILADAFAFPPAAKLPESMRDLGRHNGVRYTHEFADAAIDKVVGFLVARPPG